MSQNPPLLCWTDWVFRFGELYDENDAVVDLNGYTIKFTIKREYDDDADDSGAIFKADYTFGATGTTHDFTVPYTATKDIAGGKYKYWYMIIPASGPRIGSYDTFDCVNNVTNR